MRNERLRKDIILKPIVNSCNLSNRVNKRLTQDSSDEQVLVTFPDSRIEITLPVPANSTWRKIY